MVRKQRVKISDISTEMKQKVIEWCVATINQRLAPKSGRCLDYKGGNTTHAGRNDRERIAGFTRGDKA